MARSKTLLRTLVVSPPSFPRSISQWERDTLDHSRAPFLLHSSRSKAAALAEAGVALVISLNSHQAFSRSLGSSPAVRCAAMMTVVTSIMASMDGALSPFQPPSTTPCHLRPQRLRNRLLGLLSALGRLLIVALMP